ncbi:uncharacterized protein PSANT_04841 [Moesziomyces antarcticus]|uniref:Uncharacterized protein n=1 Tax=Pseudozyma antarctica TaxID=84753 RepID=A0A5C3FRU3_PSEA2|nr:uncharacterized protein PSANT_04841 [Moesziomyces antarcticus]
MPTSKRKRGHSDNAARQRDDRSVDAHAGIDLDDAEKLPSRLDSLYLPRSGLSFVADEKWGRVPFGASSRSIGQVVAHRRSALQHNIEREQFRIRRSLGGHTSCVNALAISRGQGRWLASGGDDCDIHVRDLFLNIDSNDDPVTPIVSLHGHQSNIFSISWAAQNKYLFSTGNDSQILYYDVEHSSMPLRSYVEKGPEARSPLNHGSIGGHDDSVPEISAHPTNPNLLLSCDDAGNLNLIDIRLPHERVSATRSDAIAGFSSVQWNPNESDGNTFAAATCGRITGSTRLYDVRQCFSSDPDRPLSSKDAVLNYHTSLMQNSCSRGLIAAAAETNSICFDPSGRFLASSVSRYRPTIYAINDPDPLATLESSIVEDHVPPHSFRHAGVAPGTPAAPKKLSSCCTIKHGSFGLEQQTGDLHYAIGSDDFRAYIFRIPPVEDLKLRREFVSRKEWLRETSQLHKQRAPALKPHGLESETKASTQRPGSEAEAVGSDESDSDSDIAGEGEVDHDSEVAYCSGSILRADRIVRPAKLDRFSYVLGGGQSIVNTALIHPTLPYIFTAGITSDITVHSAAPLHRRNLGPKARYLATKTNGGGTRPRFLLPPSGLSLLGLDSDDESDAGILSSGGEGEQQDDEGDQDDDQDDHDDEDDEDDLDDELDDDQDDDLDDDWGDDGDEGDSSGVRSVARSGFDEADRTGRSASHADGTEAGVQSDDATVHDFLAAMRTDPMYASAAPAELDFHHDRHIGTYALSHLPSSLVPPADAESLSFSSSSQAYDDGGRTSDDGDGGVSDDDDSSSASSDDDNGDGGRPVFRRRHSRDSSDDGQLSAMMRAISPGPQWVWRQLHASDRREPSRLRLFDQLLRRDEMRPLTASFRVVPTSQPTAPTCASCHRPVRPPDEG